MNVGSGSNNGLNSAGYDPIALNVVWRCFYLIGGTFLFLIILYRTLIEWEGSDQQSLELRKERRKKNQCQYGVFSNFMQHDSLVLGAIGSLSMSFFMDSNCIVVQSFPRLIHKAI
jgi:hypothetical protein